VTKEPVGSVAEEAAKLFAVLQRATDTASTAKPEKVPAAETQVAAEEKHEHKLGPDCVWCPVCQLIHKVRTTSPETIEQLSAAAAHLLGSVRSLLEAAADAARQAREDAESRSSRQEPTEQPLAEQSEADRTRSRVDRIDVSEDPEPWD
jgi:hypothetical protein